MKAMVTLTLKILLAAYILFALLKFYEFFFRSDEAKMRGLRKAYADGGRAIRVFDNVILVMMIFLVALLFASGMEYVSFTTGLLVGMTIIQVFFHRYNEPPPLDKMPEPPISVLKLASYSIQADPGKAWRELAFMTVLLLWALFVLATEGFGLHL